MSSRARRESSNTLIDEKMIKKSSESVVSLTTPSRKNVTVEAVKSKRHVNFEDRLSIGAKVTTSDSNGKLAQGCVTGFTGRERVSDEALMTALIQPLVSAFLEADSVFSSDFLTVTCSSGAARNSVIKFSESDKTLTTATEH